MVKGQSKESKSAQSATPTAILSSQPLGSAFGAIGSRTNVATTPFPFHSGHEGSQVTFPVPQIVPQSVPSFQTKAHNGHEGGHHPAAQFPLGQPPIACTTCAFASLSLPPLLPPQSHSNVRMSIPNLDALARLPVMHSQANSNVSAVRSEVPSLRIGVAQHPMTLAGYSSPSWNEWHAGNGFAPGSCLPQRWLKIVMTPITVGNNLVGLCHSDQVYENAATMLVVKVMTLPGIKGFAGAWRMTKVRPDGSAFKLDTATVIFEKEVDFNSGESLQGFINDIGQSRPDHQYSSPLWFMLHYLGRKKHCDRCLGRAFHDADNCPGAY